MSSTEGPVRGKNIITPTFRAQSKKKKMSHTTPSDENTLKTKITLHLAKGCRQGKTRLHIWAAMMTFHGKTVFFPPHPLCLLLPPHLWQDRRLYQVPPRQGRVSSPPPSQMRLFLKGQSLSGKGRSPTGSPAWRLLIAGSKGGRLVGPSEAKGQGARRPWLSSWPVSD